MESVEASGRTIEDAILQALARLGRNRDEVDIVVLQEPSRGVRGMGSREARVRVFLRAEPGVTPVPRDEADEFVPDEGYDDEYAEDADYDEAAPGYQDYTRRGAPAPPAPQIPAATTAPLASELAEDASLEEVAVAALTAILAHMGIDAQVEVLPGEEEDPLTLNVRAYDRQAMGLLIGRRGDTLAALQLLLNLIVAKQTGVRERVIVDVEGYRERREANLRSMAERVAQQVRQSGHPIMLEAMTPAERRIIHIQLSEYDDISTESEGEGDQRRVVVALKRGAH